MLLPGLKRAASVPNGLSERQRAVLFPYGVLTLLLAIIFWPAWVEGERLVVGGDTLLIHYPWWVLWRDLL